MRRSPISILTKRRASATTSAMCGMWARKISTTRWLPSYLTGFPCRTDGSSNGERVSVM